jgi:hypothetical protein
MTVTMMKDRKAVVKLEDVFKRQAPRKGLKRAESDFTAATVMSTESSARSILTQRQVQFSLESNQVFPVVHIKDMDKSDIHETWYCEQNSELMKRDIIATLTKIARKIHVEETNEETVRGLEYQTTQGDLHREENKCMAHKAVFMEQDRQRMVGVPDEELLAQAYRSATLHCQVAAFDMGLRDKQAVIKKDRRKDLQKTPSKVGLFRSFRNLMCLQKLATRTSSSRKLQN